MTPEERFITIENLLSAMAEHQAMMREHQLRHDENIRELREMQKGTFIAITKIAEFQRLTDERLKEVAEQQKSLTGQQKITEEKLHALIDTVDRIIRSR